MNRIIRLSLFTLLVVSSSLVARTLVATGTCDYAADTGLYSTWIIVTTYDDAGNVTRREGTSCDGVHWIDNCPRITLSGNPNQSSAYYDTFDSGAWLRYNVDNDGKISAMWGKLENGTYWAADTDGNANNLN